MRTMKHMVSLVVVIVMLFSMSSVGFAEDTKKVDNGTSKLSREKVESLYQKQGKKLIINDSEKVTFLDSLSKKQELKLKQNKVSKSNEDKIQVIDTEISMLNSTIEQSPVIEISYDEMVELFSLTPSVPGDTTHTSFYGMTSYVTVSGTQYKVFEIVAYSDSLSTATTNYLYSYGTINLLSSNNYTLTDLTKNIFAVADYTLSLAYVPYAIGSSVFHTLDFSPDSEQILDLNYKAQQIFVYAYVTTSGGTWYEHLQTSQKVTIFETVECVETTSGMITGDMTYQENQELASKYYADVNRPATRYHNNDITRETFRIGTLEYSIEGGNPKSVNLPYFTELYSIPGI